VIFWVWMLQSTGLINLQSAPAAQQTTVVLAPTTLQTSEALQQKFEGTDDPHCVSVVLAQVAARSRRFRVWNIEADIGFARMKVVKAIWLSCWSRTMIQAPAAPPVGRY
jgi:hypothetical protein